MKLLLSEVYNRAGQDAVSSTPLVEFAEPISTYGRRIRIRKNIHRGAEKYLSVVCKRTTAGDVRKPDTRTGPKDDHTDVKRTVRKKRS